ncbi:MAG: peptidase, partial [Thermoproteota archaeon]
SNGQIGDSDFVSGIQYLINQGIMKIPSTAPGSGTGSNVIPTRVKNNAGWWSNGQIGDSDFVSGIQYLITNGILKIK